MIIKKNELFFYFILFLKLLKNVPQNDDDYNKLSRASKLAVELIKKINDEVGRKDDYERLEWLEERILNAKNIVIFELLTVFFF